jgi:hypothetical protein
LIYWTFFGLVVFSISPNPWIGIKSSATINWSVAVVGFIISEIANTAVKITVFGILYYLANPHIRKTWRSAYNGFILPWT